MIIDLIKKLGEKSVGSFLGCYKNNCFYNINNDLSICEAKSLSKMKIVLLSRDSYTEFQKKYPVENKKELVKILKLEIQAEKNKKILFFIGDYINKKRIVTFAKVNESESKVSNLNRVLLIPESWLLAVFFPNKVVQFNSNNKYYWLFQSENQVYSHGMKGQFESISSFCAAIGLKEANIEDVVKVDELKIRETFIIKALPFIMSNFNGLYYVSKKSTFNENEWLKYGAFSLGVASVYLLLLTYYLDAKNLEAVNAKRELSSQALELITKQEAIDARLTRTQKIENTLLKPDYSIYVWKNIYPLFENKEIQITDFYILPSGKVNISGAAIRATDALSLLSQQQGVQNAQFSADVVEVNGKERFSISYELNVLQSESKDE